MTSKHKAARMKWAIEHRHWVQRQWDCVIWSDESKFEIHLENTNNLVIRKKRRRILKRMPTPSD